MIPMPNTTSASDRQAGDDGKHEPRRAAAAGAFAARVGRARRAEDAQRVADRHRDRGERREPDELEEPGDVDRGGHDWAGAVIAGPRWTRRPRVAKTRPMTQDRHDDRAEGAGAEDPGQAVGDARRSRPSAGIVRTQAIAMLPATPQRTAERRRAAPAPMTEPEIVCVVDSG